MKIEYIVKYVLYSVVFILASFLVAFHFKWRMDAAQTGKNFIIICFCLMLCWIGVGFISIFIARKIYFKNKDKSGFYNPFQLVFNDYFYKEIGIESAKKYKMHFSITAFPLFILLVVLFFQFTSYYENYQLENFGKSKEVIINRILWDKGGQRGFFNFEFEGKVINKIKYLNDSLKIGQKGEIIFSTENPYVIKWKSEHN